LTKAYANDCNYLFSQRGISLEKTSAGYSCFDKLNQSTTTTFDKTYNLNKMSYLKFLEATMFNNDKVEALKKSYELAQDAIKQYGNLFSRESIQNLPENELKLVAESYYLYGTAVSSYIEIMGRWEAVKRMSEIKNTMTMILSLKLPETFYYGAYRTLAIFNLRVPKIAGGNINRSRAFFQRLEKESTNEINVMSYPVGHIFYAEYFRKTGKNEEACRQLEKVKDLTDIEIKTYFNDLYYETLVDRDLAKEQFEKYSC
jgi:hypothetical protein